MPATVLTIGRAKIRADDINRAAREDGSALFAACNDKYEKKIKKIAQRIAKNPKSARLIMLSGPSASGKTTTSLKMQAELEALGCGAVAISMDDFFKNREDAPVNPDGTKDFESAAAVDTALLQKTLSELVLTGHTELPVFDFKAGRRSEKTRRVELDAGHVAVVEGLHALDTGITSLLPSEAMLKIYVSVSSDIISESGESVLCARDLRLIRRTIRDFHFRASDVHNTLGMWDAVCRGEDMYVRPFKKYADITVNSAFGCEPCLFRDTAVPLFSEIEKSSPYYPKARHIIEGLSAFEPIRPEIMPGSCLLREFFGGSDYY